MSEDMVPAPPPSGLASGYIKPRLSWPRAATAADLVPAWAGEFKDYEDWVSFATNRLTGTYDPMMGNEVGAICVDAVGRRCTLGGHFRRAMEEGTFPVRYFFDMLPRSDEPLKAAHGTARHNNTSNQHPNASLKSGADGEEKSRD